MSAVVSSAKSNSIRAFSRQTKPFNDDLAALHSSAIKLSEVEYSSPSHYSNNLNMFVDKSRLRELGLKLSQIKEYLEAQPFIYAAYTEDEIKNASLP